MYGLRWDNIWLRYKYLKIWDLRLYKNLNIEKIAFKVVQIKSLAVHITNHQKLGFGIYGRKFTKYLHGTWSLLNILMIFRIKKIYNFDPYNVLSIATNIPVQLKTKTFLTCFSVNICYF